MALYDKNATGSDDDAEIESLRLAALKSIKPKQPTSPYQNIKTNSYRQTGLGAAQQSRHRGFRGGKNFNRPRTNPNLISIPIVDEEPKQDHRSDEKNESSTKLILPQDRYHKGSSEDNIKKVHEPASDKFGRYDNSDKSDDSDSDAEMTVKRDESVERIIGELDNEINILDDKKSRNSDDIAVPNANKKKKNENVPVEENKNKNVPVEENKNKNNSVAKTENVKKIVHSPTGNNNKPRRKKSPSWRSRSRSISPRRHRGSRRETSVSLSPSPDRNHHRKRRDPATPPPPPPPEDPVLEARRRKFEQPAVRKSNGIIKLKQQHRTTPEADADADAPARSPGSNPNRKRHQQPKNSERPECEASGKRTRIDGEQNIEAGNSKNDGRVGKDDNDDSCNGNGNDNNVDDVDDGDGDVDHGDGDADGAAAAAPVARDGVGDDDNDDDDDDDIDDSLVLNPTADDLWSDEQSDSENEGRFKSKPSRTHEKVGTLPFAKLSAAPSYRERERERDRAPAPPPARNEDPDERRYSSRRRRKRSRTPTKSKSRKVQVKERDCGSSSAAHEHGKQASAPTSAAVGETRPSADRQPSPQPPPQSPPPPSPIETDRVEQQQQKDEGDLRAELSRRRAQRAIKSTVTAETQQVRLLKTALEDVVPNRSPVKIKTVKSAPADRRVLVLKRLNTDLESQLVESTNTKGATGKAESSKLPIRMRLGAGVGEEVGRNERKKRSRSNRKKKALSSVQDDCGSPACNMIMMYQQKGRGSVAAMHGFDASC